MEKIAVANTNHDFLEGTIALRNSLEEGFLVLGERLKKIRDEQLYEHEYDNFDSFVGEIRISRSTAYKIIGVYEKFILLGELDPADVARHGWGNLCLFLGLINSKQDARKIFDRISPLGRSDAAKELIEMKTGKPQSACQHVDNYNITVCRDCGIKIRNEKDLS